MIAKRLSIFVLPLLMGFGTCWCAETAEEKTLRQDYSKVFQEIDALGQAKDKGGLLALATDIHNTWRTRDKKYYGALMLRVCQVLRSDCADDRIPFDEIRQIARQALDTYDRQRRDNISVETEYWLVVQLQENPTYSKGGMSDEQWSADRRSKAIRWLKAWQRMERAIDKKWDPNDFPPRSVAPPAETGLPAGVVPDAIKDPTLRSEYEKAIQAAKQKAETYIDQKQLRNLKKSFSRSLLHFLASAYTIEPYNDSELVELLGTYCEDAGVKKQILDSVATKERP
jgi:hypothetical protein